jgi:hypothetical protein
LGRFSWRRLYVRCPQTEKPTLVERVVDPNTTDAPEISAATELLRPRGIFIRGYEGRAANVTDARGMIEFACSCLVARAARGYGEDSRRPYVMTGVYPQRLRAVRRNVPVEIVHALTKALKDWRRRLRHVDPDDTAMARAISDNVAFYERELAAFQRRWGNSAGTHRKSMPHR